MLRPPSGPPAVELAPAAANHCTLSVGAEVKSQRFFLADSTETAPWELLLKTLVGHPTGPWSVGLPTGPCSPCPVESTSFAPAMLGSQQTLAAGCGIPEALSHFKKHSFLLQEVAHRCRPGSK